MGRAIAIADDPLFALHRARGDHPERPGRLKAARRAVARHGRGHPVASLEPRDATDEEIRRVHDAAYLTELGRAAGQAGHFDPDTYYCADSVAAARRAAGGAIAVVEALVGGEADQGVALLRPPGHHARPGGAMGFCIVNNVAVAAAHARSLGMSRVMIVDWDVHHGNGTQEMFYDDPTVLYVSLHQAPFYPGTGAASEAGEGEGRGFTVNVPLAAGADDATYVAAFRRVVAPITEQYGPDMLLISAGFDAHAADPLAGMHLTADVYGVMLDELLRPLAGRDRTLVGVVLEGGYDLRGLEDSLLATLDRLATGSVREHPSSAALSARHEHEIEAAAEVQRAFWRID